MVIDSKLALWFVERILSKLRFDEAVVLMFCGLLVAVVGPISLVRALSGEWLQAGFDAVVVVIGALLGLYLWRSRRADIAGMIGATLCVVTIISAVYLFGTDILFWTYPATTAIFFLLPPATAARANLLVIIAIAPRAAEIGPWQEVVTFMATLLTSNVLALVFAASMRHSRSSLMLVAERDALTGTGSRYAFGPALVTALDRHREHATPVSLLVIDLDRFKQVNDSHGHETGDRVLVEIARRIDQSIRTGDHLFRYGGEEFVVIANGAPAAPAGHLAEHLCERIRCLPISGVGHVSASIGVAAARAGDSPDSWFKRADELLYRAKREGRDCVRIEIDPPAGADEALPEAP